MSSLPPTAPLDPTLLLATFTASGELVHRNDAWQQFFGDGDHPWSWLGRQDQQLTLQALGAARAGRLVTNQVVAPTAPDQEEAVPVLLNFLPVHLPRNDGVPVGAVTVTGEALAEPSTWTSSQTQRHRMETLGRMTMGIVHDFNNLLSGILGYTELMRSLIGTNEPSLATFRDHLQTVEQAALDGAALVRKIQRYIRQEKEDRFEPLDVRQLLDDCIALTRPYWYNEPRRQGIHIDVRTRFEDVPPVHGSGPELREVLINLLLNAVQAMPEGGEITCVARLGPHETVCVDVEDTGTGMPETVRQRIFEPLFTTKGANGTGMGLAVSYGIIQAHDGSIQVHSTPGEGTRFEILLPPAHPSLISTTPPAEEAPDVLATILVVDDERMVRSVLAKLLTLKGHTVVQAASGAEALRTVAEHAFDLVFTDHGMPHMSGLELARRLKERLPALPVVLVTGDSEVDYDPDVLADLVAKPFKVDDLQAAIRRVLGPAPDGRED